MLYVIAVPLGNYQDMGERGRGLLQTCPVIIGEEKKTLFRQLTGFGIKGINQKEICFLNEHSSPSDIQRLAEICRENETALITDCGTPGFCDPGAELVSACRKNNIPVRSIPGPSSLAAFLSVCGCRLDEFIFRGFLPQKKEKRKQALQSLQKEHRSVILMDTPYRLKALLSQTTEFCPQRKGVLALSLGSEKETVISGSLKQIQNKIQIAKVEKAEFILLLL